MPDSLLLVVGALGGFVLGYIVGHRFGHAEGWDEAMRRAALLNLRRRGKDG